MAANEIPATTSPSRARALFKSAYDSEGCCYRAAITSSSRSALSPVLSARQRQQSAASLMAAARSASSSPNAMRPVNDRLLQTGIAAGDRAGDHNVGAYVYEHFVDARHGQSALAGEAVKSRGKALAAGVVAQYELPRSSTQPKHREVNRPLIRPRPDRGNASRPR